MRPLSRRRLPVSALTGLPVCALIGRMITDALLMGVEADASPTKGALLEACEAIGGQSALARALGLKSQGTVSGWIASDRVPAERVLSIESLTGVSRHRLRPDLYPLESSRLKTSRKCG